VTTLHACVTQRLLLLLLLLLRTTPQAYPSSSLRRKHTQNQCSWAYAFLKPPQLHQHTRFVLTAYVELTSSTTSAAAAAAGQPLS
jgi:hypothetical protein